MEPSIIDCEHLKHTRTTQRQNTGVEPLTPTPSVLSARHFTKAPSLPPNTECVCVCFDIHVGVMCVLECEGVRLPLSPSDYGCLTVVNTLTWSPLREDTTTNVSQSHCSLISSGPVSQLPSGALHRSASVNV